MLPSLGRQDSGEYICSATNSMGTSEVTITLDVESEFFCVGQSSWLLNGLGSLKCYGTLVVNLMIFLFLRSPAPPYTTSLADNVAVRVGEVIRLQCLAHGTPPLTYSWTKTDGDLPPRAQVSGGDLQINLATAEDAGSYKCVASNNVGNSEVVIKVTVRCKLTYKLSTTNRNH